MRDTVERLEEWIMRGLWMNAAGRSCTEAHFKWKRLSYYWSHPLNFPGPEFCADSQRASTTRREKSCIKDPQFYFPNEVAARLHGFEDKLALLHPCTSARMNCGHKTARLGDSQLLRRRCEDLFPQTRLGAKSRWKKALIAVHIISSPPGGYLHWWIAVNQLAQTG